MDAQTSLIISLVLEGLAAVAAVGLGLAGRLKGLLLWVPIILFVFGLLFLALHLGKVKSVETDLLKMVQDKANFVVLPKDETDKAKGVAVNEKAAKAAVAKIDSVYDREKIIKALKNTAADAQANAESNKLLAALGVAVGTDQLKDATVEYTKLKPITTPP